MDFETLERDGVIFTSDLARVGLGAREVTHALQRGRLLRLRRGAFVRPELWAASSPVAQHWLRITAVAAAALWGMPLDEFPSDVVVLDRWRGGGRSEPGVARTARGATTAISVVRQGYECTTLARSVLDVCRGRAFQTVVPLLDWCLWERNPLAISKQELATEASIMKVSPGLWRALDFATSLSGSVGESEARAVMHQLGFPRPQLQRRFSDEEGDMFPDFYFSEADAIAEFDGKAKYTLDEFTKGDPGEVVWREKKREDRLRRQVRTVVRLLTADVRSPRLLERKLVEAGIRRPGGGRY